MFEQPTDYVALPFQVAMSPMQGRRPLGASVRALRRSRLGTTNPSAATPSHDIMNIVGAQQPAPLHRPPSATAHWVDANQSAHAALDISHSADMDTQEAIGYPPRTAAQPGGSGGRWGPAIAGGSAHWPLQQQAGPSGDPAHASQPARRPRPTQPIQIAGKGPSSHMQAVDPMDLLTAATQLPTPSAYPSARSGSDMTQPTHSHRRVPSDSMSSQQGMQLGDAMDGNSPRSGYPLNGFAMDGQARSSLSGWPTPTPPQAAAVHEAASLQRQASHSLQPGHKHGAGGSDGAAAAIQARRVSQGEEWRPPVRQTRRVSPPAGQSEFSKDGLESPMADLGSPQSFGQYQEPAPTSISGRHGLHQLSNA